MEGQQDSRFEGLIKSPHPVWSEDKDTLIILQDPQKHWNESIALKIVKAPLFQEYLCFIDEDNAAPSFAEMEDRLQVFLDVFWFGPDVATSNTK